MTSEERLLRAFWHRGRKVWVPLTDEECDKRSNTDGMARQAAVKSGLVSSERNKPGSRLDCLIYEITKHGRNKLRQIELNK